MWHSAYGGRRRRRNVGWWVWPCQRAILQHICVGKCRGTTKVATDKYVVCDVWCQLFVLPPPSLPFAIQLLFSSAFGLHFNLFIHHSHSDHSLNERGVWRSSSDVRPFIQPIPNSSSSLFSTPCCVCVFSHKFLCLFYITFHSSSLTNPIFLFLPNVCTVLTGPLLPKNAGIFTFNSPPSSPITTTFPPPHSFACFFLQLSKKHHFRSTDHSHHPMSKLHIMGHNWEWNRIFLVINYMQQITNSRWQVIGGIHRKIWWHQPKSLSRK